MHSILRGLMGAVGELSDASYPTRVIPREIHRPDVSLSTVLAPYRDVMAYDVLLSDGSSELVDGADGYAPEGPLTTFFCVEPGRSPRLDSWSTKLLSIKTERIVRIRLMVDTAETMVGVPRPRLALAE
jgi:hypothetical protein